MLSTTSRSSALDAAAAGEKGGPDRRDSADGSLHDRAGPTKGALKPHLKACWTIPPDTDAAFVAEIELSCLTKQCLGRRTDDLSVLIVELAAWTNAKNADERQFQWRFTTKDARIKLRHLYPEF